MAEVKTVVVVCGAGFATSTAGENEVKKLAKEMGIEVKMNKRRATEIKTVLSTMTPDMYLLMTPVTVELNAPKVNGVPFISGIGKDEALEEMRQILQGD